MESKQEEKFILKEAEEALKKKQEEEKHEAKAEGTEAITGKTAASRALKEEKKAGPKKEEAKAGKGKRGKKEEKEEKKREIVLERLYTIPVKLFLIGRAKMKRHTAGPRAVRAFAMRHMKVEETKVKLNPKVSQALSRGGRAKMLKKLKVKISKDKEG